MPTSRDTPTPTPLPQLKPVELLILIELFGRDHHGYGLVRAIAESTGYGVRLVSGNLYRVLLRLIERGLIKETAERPDADNDDERRRYYRITTAGRIHAQANVEQLEALAILGRNAIEADGPTG